MNRQWTNLWMGPVIVTTNDYSTQSALNYSAFHEQENDEYDDEDTDLPMTCLKILD